MKSLNAPVVEHSEVESKSSSSMSGYDSDLEDVEIEWRRRPFYQDSMKGY